MMSKHKLILHQYFDKIKLAYLESQQIFKSFVFSFLLKRLKLAANIKSILFLGKKVSNTWKTCYIELMIICLG